jgi:hypothetical protein
LFFDHHVTKLEIKKIAREFSHTEKSRSMLLAWYLCFTFIVKLNYTRGWDWEVRGSRPARAKKVCKSHLNIKKEKKKNLSAVVHACHPSNSGKHKIGGSQPRLTWADVYLQNNQNQKGYRHGSICRASLTRAKSCD